MSPNTWSLFTTPRSVAVIGASEKPGSVGGAVLKNLTNGDYRGLVYPINSARPTVQGFEAYPDIKSAPSPIDLGIIATPARTVPDIIGQCGEAGVRAAIILSAGFDEIGEEGHTLSLRVKEQADRYNVRVLGPNCVGLQSPRSGLNATFGATMPKPGSVAFLSQSGALGTAILDWSNQEDIGLSAFVSVGSMADLNWADLIDYLADDPETKSIVMYMESIGAEARGFLSAARELALTKPIVVLKAGRHDEGARAARSHTGSMAGSDDVLDAAFDRCGILRVKTIAELFYMAEALSKQPRPKGPRVTFITNAGGPGVLAADALADVKGKMTDLAPETLHALNELLPSAWSHDNPIDVLGDAPPERYAKALELALNDPNTDSVLAILTPQAMTDPAATARAVAAINCPKDKTLLASWMGGPLVAEAISCLQAASIPCYPYPDTAVRVANNMWRYTESLQNLYETPHAMLDSDAYKPDRLQAVNVINAARSTGRHLLTEYEAKAVLKAYGIPVVETVIAEDAAGAAETAARLGFPVVLKLHSDIITHKSDVGGVRLNLKDEKAVKEAFILIKEASDKVDPRAFLGVSVQPMVNPDGWELILGSRVDPQFGPVLLFGTGGRLVEVTADYALGLPPLNTTLADRMISKTKISRVLKAGARGQAPVAMDRLGQLLIAFGQMVLEHNTISEIEINPLLVSGDRLIALDARITLREDIPVPKPAIRPYPAAYTRNWTSPDGAQVTIRPIRPEDEPAMVRFHEELTDESVHQRYFTTIGLSERVAHDRLARMCFIDYDRQMALVLMVRDPLTGEPMILAVGRLMRQRGGGNAAEFALVVADQFQGQGAGTLLLCSLLEYARDMGISEVTADILPNNQRMQSICRKLGFVLVRDNEANLVTASIDHYPTIGSSGADGDRNLPTGWNRVQGNLIGAMSAAGTH